MIFRTLRSEDAPALWRINEEGLPGTGKISQDAIIDLLGLAELPLGAFEGGELVGFVLCLPPRTRYGSLNYAWFNKRYDDFLYVDRIAVSEKHRNRKIGSLLYQKVITYAQEQNCPIVAEVSLKPPNPKSMRFHDRHGFNEVGVFHHEKMSVTMMFRDYE
jgi:hypothetical protein